LRDQMAAQHPAGALIADELSKAAGVATVPIRFVVMPDDPALGEFRDVFKGLPGTFSEYPTAATAEHSGYEGASEIVDHMTLFAKIAESPDDQVALREYLRARLFDVFISDFDRHRKQWRWMRRPGDPLWHPIPEDRDQAFARYEGLLLDLGRNVDARFQNFKPKYPKRIGWLTWNGREQDRRLFAGLERPVFDETAAALKAALTDEAIDKAVATLPEQWKKRDGPRLTAALRARRDALPEVAGKYYDNLSDRVDVYMTNLGEVAEAKRLANGDLEVTVAPAGAAGPSGEPSFHRVFHAKETDEVRFYGLGGDDQFVVTGGKGPIRVRALGGAGNDVLDDSQGGGTKLSDSQGSNRVVKGPGTSEDQRTYTPPPAPKTAPWIPPRDFGAETWPIPWLGWGSDLGLFVGGGFQTTTYRFRKDPFAAQHTFRAGFSFGESSGKVEYQGIFHRENRGSLYSLYAFVSGVEVLRYYGLGNDTVNNGDKDFYKAKADEATLYPSYVWSLGRRVGIAVGPLVRYSRNEEDTGTFIDGDRPYGFGRFGEVGVHTVFALDRRDSVQYPHKGGLLAIRGTLVPEAWDVESTYGSVSANANGYVSAGQVLTLALRGGGKKVFGDYPYQSAAYIGAGGLENNALQEPDFTVRGFRAHRFGGDASVYANSDLRLRLGRINLLVPTHVGVFGLFDVGRVFLKGSSEDDTWHTSYGGGIWFSILNYRNTFSAYLAHSKEDNIFHIGGGFTF
ncbi:MAG TPA: hypothetical protein VIC87_03570, partial [Vicinamibacteria bacterium]